MKVMFIGCVGIISVVVLIWQIFRNRRVLWEKEQMELQMELEKDYYNNLEKSQQEVEKMRQDIIRYFEEMKQLLQAGKTGEIEKIADVFKEKYDRIHQVEYSRNPIINAVIYDKYSKAYDKGIGLECDIQATEELPMGEIDIVSLLGNLLDNAIEAAQQVEDGIRQIVFDIKYQKGTLFIHCKNSKDSNVCPEKQNFKTTKRMRCLHGWGRTIMKEIVEKYDGTIKEEDKGEWFETELLLLCGGLEHE